MSERKVNVFCRFSESVKIFTGNVAAPVFKRVPNRGSCDF